jgi:predicted TIM-barrel fold metal-dependent hydrolase
MPEQWNKYAPTAARRHGRPGRESRPKSVTIDVHSHVAVPAAAKFVEPYLDWATIPLAHFANAETRALSQKQEADIRARVGHDHRLADLDAMGIDVQIIAPPPPQCYYTVPIEIAVKATQIVNDGIAEFCAVKPERLKGFGAVPMTDGAEAAKELERCIRNLGFTGVEILTNVAGKELSDPAFAPFWQKAEELGALVMIHPNGFTEAARLTRFYFNNVIGNPLETTIALHYLIFDASLSVIRDSKSWRCMAADILAPISVASTMPGVRVPIVTAHCRGRPRLISSESMSIRSCSRRISSPHWWKCSVSTISCLEPITPMTWRSMTRSALSLPLRVSMQRPSRRWPEAMRRSFSGCSAELGRAPCLSRAFAPSAAHWLPRAGQMRCRRG